MRRSASEVIRNLEQRIARLERKAKYDIEVQLVFKTNTDVEMYFETEDENLADKIASHFERNWNEGHASVMLENSVEGWDGTLVRVGVTIKIRGVDTSGNNGYFNFMNKVKKFFDVVRKNGFKFDAVSSIKRTARLERQSSKRNASWEPVTDANLTIRDFRDYHEDVEEVHESFEREDGVVYALIELDDETYQVVRSEDGSGDWEDFGSHDLHRYSKAQDEFESLVEEFGGRA